MPATRTTSRQPSCGLQTDRTGSGGVVRLGAVTVRNFHGPWQRLPENTGMNAGAMRSRDTRRRPARSSWWITRVDEADGCSCRVSRVPWLSIPSHSFMRAFKSVEGTEEWVERHQRVPDKGALKTFRA